MSCDVRFNEQAACEICGRFGAFEFDGERLCGDCYEKRGSCCPEFGADDLWRCEADGTLRREETTRRADGKAS